MFNGIVLISKMRVNLETLGYSFSIQLHLAVAHIPNYSVIIRESWSDFLNKMLTMTFHTK